MTYPFKSFFATSGFGRCMLSAPSCSVINLVNLGAFKTRFLHTTIAIESLGRVYSRIITSSELKLELLEVTYKSLDPMRFSLACKQLAKSSKLLKIPSHKHSLNLIEEPLGDEHIQLKACSAQAQSEINEQELNSQVKNLMSGNKTILDKIGSQIESWAHFLSGLHPVQALLSGSNCHHLFKMT